MKPQRIEISYKTILFIVALSVILILLWSIRNILILLFICFLFAETLNPTIVSLEKLKINRAIAIILVYFSIISFISFAVAGIVPIVVEQTTGLINVLPSIISQIDIFGFSVNSIDWASQFKFIESLPTSIARLTVSIFSNFFSFFVVLFMTFYLLIERNNIRNYSFKIFGSRGREKTLLFLELLEKHLGNWVNAEIILMTTIGLLSFFSFTLIGLNYALPLAIIAGLLEAVPGLGPAISTILAAMVGLTISPMTSLLAIISGIIIQQLENNFIVPKVMKETVGINPLVTIISIAIGAQLGGILGAILAVPVYLTINALLVTMLEKK